MREYTHVFITGSWPDIAYHYDDPGGDDSVKLYFAMPSKARLVDALNTNMQGPIDKGTLLAFWNAQFGVSNLKGVLPPWDAHPGFRGSGWHDPHDPSRL